MPSTFTPSDAVNMSNEREWAASLGMLDWDTTQIVFTKRSLLEFLKYAGVTVDPNFTIIQKLPRYARFGTIADGEDAEPRVVAPEEPSVSETSQAAYRPSRRVRAVPGGSHTSIFGNDDNDDVLATAPPLKQNATVVQNLPAQQVDTQAAVSKNPEVAVENDIKEQKPKSKRTTSSVASLWDAPDDSEQFKPTRRVREMPGGKDNISGLF